MSVVNQTFVGLSDGAAHLSAKADGFLLGLFSRSYAWQWVLTALCAVIVYDQVMYIWAKGSIAGTPLKIPFCGPFFESVWPDFNRYVAKWNSGDLSCVSVFHKFVVLASSREMSRKAFNAPNYAKPCVVDIAYKLLRPTNWVFLDGKAHVDYRKGLNGLFTRQALELYLPRQEEVYDRYYAKFVDITEQNDGKHKPWMPQFRELMCAVALRTFVGYYMSDDAVKKIADDYYHLTASLDLVNFPIILPYTRTWYGKKAADMILEEFSKCATKAKARMSTGAPIGCILDAWVAQMIASAKYREKLASGVAVDQSEKPDMILRDFTDFEIAQTLLTFLFASQDATSSACTWLFQLMADQPHHLDKIREENLRARNGDKNVPFSMDLLEGLTYTRAVVKEVLRYRPPVLMVPYQVKKDFPLSDTYTAPKGSMVVPATWPALHDPEAYPNPDTFDPLRWIDGDADKQVKNWLVFGTGPHYCLGQTYAQLNLMAMIGKASMMLDWTHEVTPLSEVIKIFATIFPKDDCHLAFSKRTQ